MKHITSKCCCKNISRTEIVNIDMLMIQTIAVANFTLSVMFISQLQISGIFSTILLFILYPLISLLEFDSNIILECLYHLQNIAIVETYCADEVMLLFFIAMKFICLPQSLVLSY